LILARLLLLPAVTEVELGEEVVVEIAPAVIVTGIPTRTELILLIGVVVADEKVEAPAISTSVALQIADEEVVITHPTSKVSTALYAEPVPENEYEAPSSDML